MMATASEVCQRVLWRFSVDDYAKMLTAGILDEKDRVELIDGEVRCMSPIGTRHYAMVNYLNRKLVQMVGEAGIVSIQNPIQLDDYTEPEPDVVVMLPRPNYYADSKILPADILLVIEVADSSLNYDRHEKLPRYATAGVPEVWIVDIEVDQYTIEQYSAPHDGHYSSKKEHSIGETVVSVSMPDTIRLVIEKIFG